MTEGAQTQGPAPQRRVTFTSNAVKTTAQEECGVPAVAIEH
jgi:hypothetical protein